MYITTRLIVFNLIFQNKRDELIGKQRFGIMLDGHLIKKASMRAVAMGCCFIFKQTNKRAKGCLSKQEVIDGVLE